MKESNQKIENKYLTVPRVSKLLFMYEPSFLLNPVVSVLELSDPARSIKCYKQKFRTNASWNHIKKNGNVLCVEINQYNVQFSDIEIRKTKE